MCGIIVCYEIVTRKAGNYGTVAVGQGAAGDADKAMRVGDDREPMYDAPKNLEPKMKESQVWEFEGVFDGDGFLRSEEWHVERRSQTPEPYWNGLKGTWVKVRIETQ